MVQRDKTHMLMEVADVSSITSISCFIDSCSSTKDVCCNGLRISSFGNGRRTCNFGNGRCTGSFGSGNFTTGKASISGKAGVSTDEICSTCSFLAGGRGGGGIGCFTAAGVGHITGGHSISRDCRLCDEGLMRGSVCAGPSAWESAAAVVAISGLPA